MTLHSRWEEQMVRERTDPHPHMLVLRKMKALTQHSRLWVGLRNNQHIGLPLHYHSCYSVFLEAALYKFLIRIANTNAVTLIRIIQSDQRLMLCAQGQESTMEIHGLD